MEKKTYQNISELVKKPLDTKLLCLVKITQQQYAESLADGAIFCRHLTYYKDPKFALEPFYDAHEGLSGVFQPELITLEFKDPKTGKKVQVDSNDMTAPIVVSGNLEHPAFCLHAIHTGEWTHRQFTIEEINVFRSYLQIPDAMNKFNDWVWVITNGEEFIKRLNAACLKEGVGAHYGFVHYLSLDAVHGKVPQNMVGFVKQAKHSIEREYRFVFFSKQALPDPFVLQMGSLRDISTVMPLKQFLEEWQISVTD